MLEKGHHVCFRWDCSQKTGIQFQKELQTPCQFKVLNFCNLIIPDAPGFLILLTFMKHWIKCFYEMEGEKVIDYQMFNH